MPFQTSLHRLHGFLGEGDPFFVDLAGQFHDRMDPLPGHAFCPRQHGLGIR